jgi:lactate dehydrogenase-like 2-hydroxyacid dehydrogenase
VSGPDILVLVSLIEQWHDELGGEFTIHHVRPEDERMAVIAAAATPIRAVITNGTTGIDAETLAALPDLEIIASFSAGYERVDVAAARARGIAVTHGPGVNAASAADHAIGLMIAAGRGIARRDRMVRDGEWGAARGLAATVSGKRLGIIGLGAVGAQIARRAAAFDMSIAYHNRRPRDDAGYDYAASVEDLAKRSDYLVVSCPGGEATRHIVDADVLAALGPDGYLINVARGSVVDTDALIATLENQTIAGAALDVFEDEPEVPDVLRHLDNVVLSPHVAGFTPEAFRAGFELLRDNLRAHFAGDELVTPVP